MRRFGRLVFALVTAVGIGACDSDDDDDQTGPQAERFTAILRGSNEAPPNTSTATGTATFTINANRTITYDLSFSGISTPVTGHHIHGPAAPGVNAPVIVGLTPGTNQTISDASNFPTAIKLDSLIALMRSGQTYVNVHSEQFRAGEIRGQLTRANN